MWGGGGALLLLFQPYYYFFNLVLISPVSPGCLSFTVPSTCLAQHSEFCSCLFQLFLTSLAPPTPHTAQVSAQKAEPVAKVKQETLPSTVFLMPRTDRPSGNKLPPSSILLLLGRATHSSPRLTFQDTTRSRAGRAAELRGNTFLLALAAPLRAQGALREPRPRATQPPRRCCARSHR